jgi:hypothetical protein
MNSHVNFVLFTWDKNLFFENLYASIEYPDVLVFYFLNFRNFEICFQTMGSYAQGAELYFHIITIDHIY